MWRVSKARLQYWPRLYERHIHQASVPVCVFDDYCMNFGHFVTSVVYSGVMIALKQVIVCHPVHFMFCLPHGGR